MTRLGRLVPLAIIALGFVLFFVFDLDRFITLESLARHHAALLAFVGANPIAAWLVYVGLYVLVTGFSVPGATVMTLAGGVLFGTIIGALGSVIGATTGAAAIFLATRTALGEPLRARAGPWLMRLEAGFRRDAFNYLLTLRLIPIFPFFAVNLVPAFLGVPLRTFVLATFLGIIPGTVVFTSIGAGLGDLIATGETLTPGDLLSPEIVLGLAGLGLLSLAPVAYRRWRRRDTPPPPGG